ncbi:MULTISPECIES: SMP-30/gluconolactonase/LRE family protein [unclassified Oleiphilus]|uniref:SMP-30/gluconolactonase/LRE family protein n=3 Tax=Oleiphilus TaxID=141450 RepID=UPI0007C3C511|nr:MULTISPECIES: SMP-30/gluconolactonase/LRE family protein [unclassified Oleiphilus]KZY64876.1 hypothetical protein A3738_09815 [Oleiphilus sp. HI0066]KZY71487.1 hypothetical protein A3739_04620 [Oleiphilus sp. HI0067]
MNILKLVLFIFLITIAVFVWRSWPIMNLGYDIANVNTDYCAPVAIEAGPEDITVDLATGEAFIATDARRDYLKYGTAPQTPGAIWVKDLNSDNPPPVKIEANYPEAFHPHGISLLKENGKRYLFVVNHPSTTFHQIDIFELESSHKATLLKSVTSDLFISPNDIFATSLNEFYVTNDHGAPRHTPQEKVEDFFRLANSNVVHYKDGKATIALDDLYMANGITIDEDGKIYVAESTGLQITQYSKDTDESWKATQRYDLEVIVDNLEWSDTGKLLVASHQSALYFLMHTFEHSNHSPSIAHEIDTVSGEINLLYMSDGAQLSGASVAAQYKDSLLIGSVFEEHYLHCKSEQLASR